MPSPLTSLSLVAALLQLSCHAARLGSNAAFLYASEGDVDPPDFVDGDDSEVQAHWALLIAGSSGWGNYRHQADVSHAYHVLRRGGYQERHIVVMMFDDIASSTVNPCPGTIFNNPAGRDVYGGVKIDYRSYDVTAANFLAVLAGNLTAMRGIGSGRVIASGSEDRVFVFYSDHGSVGILGMPSGEFLWADMLMHTMRTKHQAGGYKEAVLYIEACESGSMFQGLPYASLNVYIATASNAEESSWGTYCPGFHSPLAIPEFNTCLGDLFSVAWMEESEEDDLTQETLKVQFSKVKDRTSDHNTYSMGSHAMQYGLLKVQNERAGDYLGMNNSGEDVPPVSSSSSATYLPCMPLSRGGNSLSSNMHRVPQRDADLVHLRVRAQHSMDPADKAAAQTKLDMELAVRQHADASALYAVHTLFLAPASSHKLVDFTGLRRNTVFASVQRASEPLEQLETVHQQQQPVLPWVLSALPLARAAWSRIPSNSLQAADTVVALVASGSFGRPSASRPVVDSWDCMREMVVEWSAVCGRMDDYTMRHTRLLVNLCNAGLSPAQLGAALSGAPCTQLPTAKLGAFEA